MAGDPNGNGEVTRRKEIEAQVAAVLQNVHLREEEMADQLKQIVDEYDPLPPDKSSAGRRRRSRGWLGRLFHSRS
jgi:hypothetical protein